MSNRPAFCIDLIYYETFDEIKPLLSTARDIYIRGYDGFTELELAPTIANIVIEDCENFVGRTTFRNTVVTSYLRVGYCDNFIGYWITLSRATIAIENCDMFKGINFTVDNTGNVPYIAPTLYVANCRQFTANHIPRDVRIKLHLTACNGFTGIKESTEIVQLAIGYIDAFVGDTLPTALKSLSVLSCPNFTGDNLPEGLNDLRVYKCGMFTGNDLPRGLSQLYVTDCHWFTGNNLPHISELEIENCPLYNFKLGE